MLTIHVIDDDSYIRALLLEHLSSLGYDVAGFATAEAALNVLEQDPPNVVLLDMKLPGMSGMDLLKIIKEKINDVEVIIITAYADVETAVKAIKLGAREYVKKPFDLNEITHAVRKAITDQQKDEQFAYLEKENRSEFSEFIGTSRAMQEVFSFIRQIAKSSNTSVLIQGETGTGKELVARAIHAHSPRSAKPFIEVNCSAHEESQLEIELFGQEPGPVSGSIQRKKGLLELAEEGTLFIDEISAMSMKLQVKMLKAIEDHSFRRVGGGKDINTHVRIISSTSQDLEERVKGGEFMQGLFYRLNVASIKLPPLKKRSKDVILLADHFIEQYNKEFSKQIVGLSEETKLMLLNHPWPGNVRELRNVIERGVLFENGETLSADSVALMDLSETDKKHQLDEGFFRDHFEIPEQGISLAEIEDILIEKAIKSAKGNQSLAAKLLGVTREKLRYRLKKISSSPQPEA